MVINNYFVSPGKTVAENTINILYIHVYGPGLCCVVGFFLKCFLDPLKLFAVTAFYSLKTIPKSGLCRKMGEDFHAIMCQKYQ